MHKNLCTHAHFIVHHDNNTEGDRTDLLAGFAPSPSDTLYRPETEHESWGSSGCYSFLGVLRRCRLPPMYRRKDGEGSKLEI
jgi:hypothetical protein